MADLEQRIREKVARRPSVFPGMVRPSETYDRYKGWSDRSAAALLAVLDRHKPEPDSMGGRVSYYCANCRDTGWLGPGVDWPCETVEDIAKELGIEVDRG